tara:strand:- start:53 stop:565 length:513 start_codon:yes stop_codon:yes gene_type:complete
MSNAVAALNALTVEGATTAFIRCCGSSRWASLMAVRRPFSGLEAILRVADQTWEEMEESDILEAFEHHPRIGADLESLREKFASTKEWSSSEQAAVSSASEETLLALRDGNIEYEKRYGFIFITCASGRSAEEILKELNSRMHHNYGDELQIAAQEQAKITRLRLEKLEL